MRVLFLSFLFLVGVLAAAWAFFGGQLRIADLEQAADTAKTTLAKLEDSLTETDTKKDQKPKIGSGNGFDVARVVPDGASVFAGQTEPDTYVTVVADGEKIGTAKSDDIGEWVVIAEHKFNSDDPKLSLSTSKTPPPKPDTKVASLDDQPANDQPTARDVTNRLMNQLEDMVETARKENAAPAKAVKEAPKVTAKASDSAPETSGPSSNAETKNVVSDDVDQQNQATPATAPATAAANENTATTTDGASTKEPATKPIAKTDGAAPPTSSSATTQAAPSREKPETENSAQQTPVETQREVAGWAEPRIAPKTSAKQAANTVEASSSTADTKVVPVPIKFEYRKATLTEEGRRAAALLLEYAKLKRYRSLTLTGHADERGTNQLNLNLSQARLNTVKEYLEAGGFSGELNMIPKGETEPFSGVDRSAFATQELWELDRRVELRSVE